MKWISTNNITEESFEHRLMFKYDRQNDKMLRRKYVYNLEFKSIFQTKYIHVHTHTRTYKTLRKSLINLTTKIIDLSSFIHRQIDRQNDKTSYQLGEYTCNEHTKKEHPKYIKIYKSMRKKIQTNRKINEDIQGRTYEWSINIHNDAQAHS